MSSASSLDGRGPPGRRAHHYSEAARRRAAVNHTTGEERLAGQTAMGTTPKPHDKSQSALRPGG